MNAPRTTTDLISHGESNGRRECGTERRPHGYRKRHPCRTHHNNKEQYVV